VIFRFGAHELDLLRRELRERGRVVAMQPQVFELLAYLVERHERAVSKDELLDAIWTDLDVLEGSLQRTVSQARAALGDAGHELIRTLPKHGYRFAAKVTQHGAEQAAPTSPVIQYAVSDDLHVAYSVLGSGDVDLVLVLGWTFSLRSLFEEPQMAKNLAAWSRIGRVIVFDKRGTGLSDRVKKLPSLQERMRDLQVVLDAAESKRAIVVGISEGGPLALTLAAAAPERLRGLVLVGAFACLAGAPDHPIGWTVEEAERLRGYIRTAWGSGKSLLTLAPSRVHEPEYRAWAARAERDGASPGAALDLFEMNLAADVRALLPDIEVPTVVLHHTDDRQVDVRHGRELAAKIPGARLIELPGDDHVFAFQHAEVLEDALARLVCGAQSDFAKDDEDCPP
jgi:pimeloyl-ACP methyl ester carboxylesterase/DNA-binding winged helix-turn-helix (wHTH) protein